ncbi:MAG: hypothetical protein QMC79_10350 [Anaerosomatales bacterium]|nr:hypothetical protein [Anaerosomatales bacterium]
MELVALATRTERGTKVFVAGGLVVMVFSWSVAWLFAPQLHVSSWGVFARWLGGERLHAETVGWVALLLPHAVAILSACVAAAHIYRDRGAHWSGRCMLAALVALLAAVVTPWAIALHTGLGIALAVLGLALIIVSLLRDSRALGTPRTGAVVAWAVGSVTALGLAGARTMWAAGAFFPEDSPVTLLPIACIPGLVTAAWFVGVLSAVQFRTKC